MKIRCKIKPNSKKGNLIRKATDENGDFYEIFVRDPAVEGRANLAVIKLLSEKTAQNLALKFSKYLNNSINPL